GDVDATDQENESNRTKQQDERLAKVADDGFAERSQANCPLRLRRIVRWELRFQRFDKCIEFRLRRGDREPGHEARSDLTMQTQATLWRRIRRPRHPRGQPHFVVALFGGRAEIAKSARHDADNAIGVIVEDYRFAENVRIGGKCSAPQTIADYG